jgi:hypothetical protein
MLPIRDEGIFDATWMASFRSRASIVETPELLVVSANGPSVVETFPCGRHRFRRGGRLEPSPASDARLLMLGKRAELSLSAPTAP